MDLEHILRQFQRLRVNTQDGHASPHKPCMLLAVIEMLEAGVATENMIPFSDALIERYVQYFEQVKRDTDWPNPWFPFFHLSNDQLEKRHFWFLKPVPGKEAVVGAMTTARSRSDITGNIAHIELDPSLHDLIRDPEQRAHLREKLIVTWFPEHAQRLRSLVTEIKDASAYERKLRGLNEEKNLAEPTAAITEKARSAAFRHVVLEAYDYRCAATGYRIVLPDSTAMVEAAHIVPFSVTNDDSPSNGIALSPNMHWAMDRNIIAPGPDLKWHVSDIIDLRIPDFRPFAELAGAGVFAPNDNSQFAPSKDALEWRRSRLLSA
jgi:putative restriction endonuclease|tara:strand:- start:5672 stop:6634 length:963 start_codon:yes stop_codon:yes gene_type:complete